MNNYSKQRDWENSKHDLIKKELSKILSPCGSEEYHHVFEEAPKQMDCEECTDLIDHKNRRYGLRIRNANNYQKVPDSWLSEITIRSKTAYNAETEITKIQKGFLDYYFYCWLHNNEIMQYHFLDAKKLLPLLKKYKNLSRKIINRSDNTEGIAYSVEHLQDAIIRSKYEH
tara:strand:+ start:883 stop:1395 length:513 start_codon:yes stop_codon:yes gene_type:complete